MSFHPKMAYGATFHKSARKLADEGPPFVYTPENRARFDEIVTRYPPERRRSAVLPALYLVQYQQGYITANAMRYVAGLLEHHAGRRRGRRVVLHDVLHEAGRQVRAAGLPDAVVRAERRRAGDRGAARRSSASSPGETDAERHVHAVEVECLGACDRAPVVMVNDAWHECLRAGGRRRSCSTICARAAKRR